MAYPPWKHGKLAAVKKKLEHEHIEYTESVYHDTLKLHIGPDFELMFCSPLSIHKSPEEWTDIDPKELNLKLCGFYLMHGLLI